jgi:N-acetyltransferase
VQVEPVTLEGRHVRLEPLSWERHGLGLCAIAPEPSLWRWTTTALRTPGDVRRYVEDALGQQAQGAALAFATVERAGGAVAGSTRFAAIAPAHRRVEIGWTWLAPRWQRTALNTEAKYLMMRHAFETWGCRRVELKTDTRNLRSRAAILRLGAREEGVLRRHMINADGTARDTVYFSVLDDEWPAVRLRLEGLLARA